MFFLRMNGMNCIVLLCLAKSAQICNFYIETTSWQNALNHGILRLEKNMIKVLFICHGKVSPKWQRTSIYNGFSHLSRWISHTFPTIWSLWHSTDDFPLTSVGGIFNEKLNAVKNDRVQIFAISKKHPDIFHTVVGKISLIILGKLFLDTIQ